MDMAQRVAQVKRPIEFIATAYHETDDVIHGALSELVTYIGELANAIPSGRAEFVARMKAEADRVAGYKAQHAATGAPPLPVINADINKATP